MLGQIDTPKNSIKGPDVGSGYLSTSAYGTNSGVSGFSDHSGYLSGSQASDLTKLKTPPMPPRRTSRSASK